MSGLELPGPRIDFASINSKSVNDYSLASMPYSVEKNQPHRSGLTFIVRAYSGNIVGDSQLTRLVKGIVQHCRSPPRPHQHADDCDVDILIIIISMDKQSVSLIDQAIKSLQSVLANVPFTNNFKIELYQHYIPLHVYDDNCCQIYDMCISQKYQHEYHKAFLQVYGHYKDIEAKKRSICEYNNLLQYTLTDIALQYVLNQCDHDDNHQGSIHLKETNERSSSTSATGSSGHIRSEKRSYCKHNYVLMTNADNEYSASFVPTILSYFNTHSTSDVVIFNYRENKHVDDVGSLDVDAQVALNRIDLGAMVFRASSLSKQNVSILTSMPKRAWPHHWYAADGLFLLHLKQKGFTIGKIREKLFTHW